MSEHIVTALDITGIQGYIFGSNKLRDNIGASQLVEWATKQWLYDTLNSAGGARITVNDETFNTPAIEDRTVQSELIYAGGGNAVILFADLAQARCWATAYSRFLLEHAPGLGFVIAHSPPFVWNPAGGDLPQIVDDLKNTTLATAKQTAPSSAPLLGLSVMANCQSTGLPAVAYYREGTATYRPVSSEVQAKTDEKTLKSADARFRKMLHWFEEMELLPARDFDNLVGDEDTGTRDQGYIAVVHADGNAMGRSFQQLGAQKQTNRAYIQAIRTLSAHVQQAGQRALAQALGGLIAPNGQLITPFQNRTFFPVRALVYGGDDVTFVCDGQLGLALAARYLQRFEAETETVIGQRYTACAGISIIKVHYPFARAYGVSEDLCAHAKNWMKKRTHFAENSYFSALDWHIAQSGLLGELGEIREREYSGKAGGSLALRPIRLRDQQNEWRTWPAFRTILHTFKYGEEWSGKRNKVIRLREVLREGEERTRQFLKLYRLRALPIYDQASGDLAEQGWTSSDGMRVCGYFDVIEALEFFTPLEGEAQ